MTVDPNPNDQERFQLSMLCFVFVAGLVDMLDGYFREWADDLRNSVSQNI